MVTAEEKTKEKKAKKSIFNLLEKPNIPDSIKALLEEAKEKGKVDEYTLGVEVIKIIENDLLIFKKTFLDSSNTPDDLKKSSDGFAVCFACLKHLVEFEDLAIYMQLKVKHLLVSIVESPSFEMKIRNQMCQIAEKIIEVNKTDDDDRGASLIVYLFLLDLNLNGSKVSTRTDMKRLWSMHHVLKMYDLMDVESKPILSKLIRTVSCHNFLNYKEGRLHIANFLSLQPTLVKQIQKEIMDNIGKNKLLGHFYGEIYFSAWNNAKKQVKDEIESECIQSLMSRFFRLQRRGLDMDPMTKVIFKILSHLHHSRRLINFSSAITRLYTPLIWRSLKSHHPLERCNAAEIFFDVFPLEKPEQNIVENSLYQEKQFQCVIDLLNDSCHFCRVIAVKGVCRILANVSECLSNSQCKELLYHLTNESANDCSNPLVRQAVYQGFTYMLSEPASAALLQTILPQMTDYCHDVNPKVRKAFVEMLIKIQDSEHCTLKYMDVVPVEQLIVRLSLEKKPVGELIVKLIMNKFYTKEIGVSEMISRLDKLIKLCPTAAEKLFLYSSGCLTVGEMHLVILSILSYLRRYVQKKVDPNGEKRNREEGDTENDSPVQPKKKKKRKHAKVLEESSQNVLANESNQTPEEFQYEIDDDTVNFHAQLFICMQVGWLAFYEKLNLPENSEMLENLYKLTVGSLQLFLRYYRGTPAYYATIAFCSLIPIGKLVPTTTVTSSCMSELKITDEDTPDEVIKTLLYSLCAWNRGNEVIELCIDWMDPAFKFFQLNASSVVKPGKRKVTVRFQKSLGKHVHAARILSLLFSDYINESRMTKKCYETVLELYHYMDRIKVVIDRRIEGRADFPSDHFSDNFILECFQILLGLTHVLHRPDLPPQSSSMASVDLNPFNAPEVHVQFLDWAASILIPRLPEKVELEYVSDKIVLHCLLKLLKSCDLNIRIKLTDELHCKAVGIFVNKLLATEWSLWFLETSLSIVTHMCEHSEAWVKNDSWFLFSRICPSVYSGCLSTFAEEVVSENSLKDFKLDIKEIRKHIMFLPSILLKLFGANDYNFKQVFNYVFNACIQGIMRHINSIQEVELYKSFESFPFFISFMVKHIIADNKLKNQLLPTLRKFLSENNKDDLSLMGCLSFLYTLVSCYKSKFVTLDLEVAVHESFTHLVKYTPPPLNDDSFQDGFSVDVYSTGMDTLKKIGEIVGCSIHPPT